MHTGLCDNYLNMENNSWKTITNRSSHYTILSMAKKSSTRDTGGKIVNPKNYKICTYIYPPWDSARLVRTFNTLTYDDNDDRTCSLCAVFFSTLCIVRYYVFHFIRFNYRSKSLTVFVPIWWLVSIATIHRRRWRIHLVVPVKKKNMNVLQVVGYTVYDHRWLLICAVTVVGIGFMFGCGYRDHGNEPIDQAKSTNAITGGTTDLTYAVKKSTDCCQTTQKKIEKIARNVDELLNLMRKMAKVKK